MLAVADGGAQAALRAIGQGEGPHHGDALHVLEDGAHDGALGLHAAVGNGTRDVLHDGIDAQHADDGGGGKQAAAQVHHGEHEHHDHREHEARDDVGVDDATGILHVVEGIGHGAGDLPQAVVIEVAHGQIAHAIADLRTLLAAHGEVAVAEVLALEVCGNGAACHGDEHDGQ